MYFELTVEMLEKAQLLFLEAREADLIDQAIILIIYVLENTIPESAIIPEPIISEFTISLQALMANITILFEKMSRRLENVEEKIFTGQRSEQVLRPSLNISVTVGIPSSNIQLIYADIAAANN